MCLAYVYHICCTHILHYVLWNFLSVNKYFFTQQHLFSDFKCGFVEVFFFFWFEGWIFFLQKKKQMGFMFHVLVAENVFKTMLEHFFFKVLILIYNNYKIYILCKAISGKIHKSLHLPLHNMPHKYKTLKP